jgi:uncharacterized damage-inducible protein DinB
VDFVRLFRYDDWANREELRTLRESSNARAVRLLAHIIGSQWLWYARLRGEPPREAVWPDISLDGCEQSLDLIGSFWMEFASDADMNATIAYTNSKGEPWTSRIEDVLMHVILHGAYHRGQIATLLRAGGEEPAYTDYIHCTRNEFI